MNARAYVLQRLTALVMAPLVLVHLVLIVYAVRGGLDAGEILARTRGSVGWALFYGTFVLAVSVHAGLGLRNVLVEWTRLGATPSAAIAHLFMLVVLLLGLGAVYAVVAA